MQCKVFSGQKKLLIAFGVILATEVLFFALLKDFIISLFTDRGYSFETAFSIFRYAFVLIAAVTVLIAVAARSISAGDIVYERFFAFLVIGFGVVFCFLITPFSPPDELTHYLATFRLSNKILLKDPDIAESALLNYSIFSQNNNTISSLAQMLDAMRAPFAEGYPVSIATRSAELSHNYFLEYLMPALGLSFARLMKLNFMWSFFFGRLFNLAFFSMCVYIAVKRVPKYKILYGMTALLPMALQQAASYSYDSFINGLSLVLTASLLKMMMDDRRITWEDYLFVLVPFVLVTPAKGVFGFIIMPVVIVLSLLIPSVHFKGTKKAKALAVAGLVFASLSIFWLFRTPTTVGNTFENENLAGILQQTSAAGNNTLFSLLKVSMVFFRTFQFSFTEWLCQATGSILSGLSLALPTCVPPCFLMVLFLSVLNEQNEPCIIPVKSRFLILLSALFSVFIVMGALYLTWTDSASTTIAGIQGRYFFPIFPLFFISVSNQTIIVKHSINKILLFSFLLIEVFCVLFILSFTIL